MDRFCEPMCLAVRSDLLNFFVSALDLNILCLREGAVINGNERARFKALGVQSDLSNFFREEERGTRGAEVSQNSEEQREDQNPDYKLTELGFFHVVAPPGTINIWWPIRKRRKGVSVADGGDHSEYGSRHGFQGLPSVKITCNLCGVSCTGKGENIIKGILARDIAAVMEYKRLKL
ncbi:hypothetical protein Sjap_005681 [Stephania japonica]|uniref:Uncharacterized protein n=1 Tax=Stephania japonica TaxID=461633 RepID=A0AAP0PI83_9MAGN